MAVDNFIPVVWSSRLQVNLHKALVFGAPNVINRDYEGEIQEAGNTVKIQSIGTVTVTDYVKNQDMASPQVLSDAQATLVIDQSKAFNFQVDDVDQAQAKPKFMNSAMGEAAYAIRNTADIFIRDTMMADVSAANTVGTFDDSAVLLDTTGAAGTNAYERIVDLSVLLDENNVPEEDRWCIVTPWVEGLLLKDARFVSFGTPENKMALTNGRIGQVSGFNIYKSNNIARVTNTKTAFALMAGHGMATTFADQINKVVAYSPEKRFGDAVKGLHLYGAKVTRPYALARLNVRAS